MMLIIFCAIVLLNTAVSAFFHYFYYS
jgi:hypothetical protein